MGKSVCTVACGIVACYRRCVRADCDRESESKPAAAADVESRQMNTIRKTMEMEAECSEFAKRRKVKAVLAWCRAEQSRAVLGNGVEWAVGRQHESQVA